MQSAYEKRKEHLQERFLRLGIDGLMPRDAIELLLSYAMPKGAELQNLVDALFERFGNISGILNADPRLLAEVPGITDEAVDVIHFQPQIYAILNTIRIYDDSLDNVEKACGYFYSQLRWQPVEQFKMVVLSRELTALSCETIGEGSGSEVRVDVDRIIGSALNSGSRVVMIGHNHPSGSCKPSNSDIRSTEAVRDALKKAGIELLDHIIVGVDGACSMMRSEVCPLKPDGEAIEAARKLSAHKRKKSNTSWI